MRTELKEVDGIDWNDGAVCNCTWSGPLLADVLTKAGIAIDGDAHVAFSCLKTDCQQDRYYGSSICLTQCMDSTKKVILALDVRLSYFLCTRDPNSFYQMNGSPLSINHGAPIRVVLPGIAGARWTKWLDRITVQRHESTNFYMQQDYKILPPSVETREQAKSYWHLIPPLQEMPINSAIAYPARNEIISADKLINGRLEVAGYALPQGDCGPVVKVEVSTDQGVTWDKAEIVFPDKRDVAAEGGDDKYRWSWAIWKFRLSAEATKQVGRETRIWCRALDKAGNLQKRNVEWNLRGVGYNAYGEVKGLEIMDSGCDQELIRRTNDLSMAVA